jgi:hypothetical protein
MKGMHPLYHIQVVSGDDDVRIALMKPQKWATQLAPKT